MRETEVMDQQVQSCFPENAEEAQGPWSGPGTPGHQKPNGPVFLTPQITLRDPKQMLQPLRHLFPHM